MADNYKVVYNCIETDVNSPNYGFVVENKKTFPSFESAHRFYRSIILAIKVVGKPIIEKV